MLIESLGTVHDYGSHIAHTLCRRKNDISVQPDTEDIVIETGWLDELPWPQRLSQRSAGVDGKISLQKDSRFDVV